MAIAAMATAHSGPLAALAQANHSALSRSPLVLPLGPHERSAFPSANIVFVKVQKCASSTMGGIVRRIAAHHNLSGVRESHTWIEREPGAGLVDHRRAHRLRRAREGAAAHAA